MKNALIALAVAAALVLGFWQLQKRPKHGESAPLPPAAATPSPPAVTPLADAVQASLANGSKSRLEEELAKGASPNDTDKNGRPVLTLAVRNNDEAAVSLLLAKGADPNGRDRDMHWTPLMHAAYLAARDPKFLRVMNVLLSHGADPNATKEGTTPLHIAVNNSDARAREAPAIEMLLRAGAKPDGVPVSSSTAFSATPLTLAAWNGNMAASLALARAGADVSGPIVTARNNKHPELATALAKFAKGGAKPVAKSVKSPKRRHR
jgi:ankyrin repeat protein